MKNMALLLHKCHSILYFWFFLLVYSFPLKENISEPVLDSIASKRPPFSSVSILLEPTTILPEALSSVRFNSIAATTLNLHSTENFADEKLTTSGHIEPTPVFSSIPSEDIYFASVSSQKQQDLESTQAQNGQSVNTLTHLLLPSSTIDSSNSLLLATTAVIEFYESAIQTSPWSTASSNLDPKISSSADISSSATTEISHLQENISSPIISEEKSLLLSSEVISTNLFKNTDLQMAASDLSASPSHKELITSITPTPAFSYSYYQTYTAEYSQPGFSESHTISQESSHISTASLLVNHSQSLITSEPPPLSQFSTESVLDTVTEDLANATIVKENTSTVVFTYKNEGFHMTTPVIVGITLGCFSLLLIILLSTFVCHRVRAGTSSPGKISDYSGLQDDSISLSYMSSQSDLKVCAQEPHEEMVSLDDDGYLKSLETMYYNNRANHIQPNTKF